MDIRGIEVTNQLRSAIRAKLLELGVRYDEELPDYILVMVVNKKTRQQMHEDLCLFLEDSTSPFVDWLHDQVLKKLQKVTVAKKKSSRDLVPTVIVKQEEERKKKKSCPTSFLEDQTTDQMDKTSQVLKQSKKIEKLTKPPNAEQILESDVTQSSENLIKKTTLESKSVGLSNVQTSGSIQEQKEAESPKKVTEKVNYIKSIQTLKVSNSAEHLSKSSIEAEINVKISEISSKNSKKISSDSADDKVELGGGVEKLEEKDDEVDEESEEETEEESSKKLKSSVNKPRITSVVTVKNRLEFPPSRNKFDLHKSKPGFESNYRKVVKGVDKHEFEGHRRNDILFGSRNIKSEDYFRKSIGKSHDFETRNHEPDRNVDIKSRLGNIRDEHSRDKSGQNQRSKTSDKLTNSIKDRLGSSSNSMKIRDDLLNKKKELPDESRGAKFTERERPVASNSSSSIKNRLGPVKNVFKTPDIRRRLNLFSKTLPSNEDDDSLNLHTEDDTDDDITPATAIGPIKSRIIAVKRSFSDRGDRKRSKMLNDSQMGRAGGKGKDNDDDDDEKDVEDGKIASKVIVTPRPLRPLQPLQKRATQSLLLRAVAEANQSVVRQKNPEPVLTEKATAQKRAPTTGIREGQNLSVRLNSSKRLVMEKIQVELTTGESEAENPEPYVPQPVTDEHMGVVMSLFQRSNDSQKFLVTLNGYNNNVSKEKGVSDEDERLEMEVNEDDDFLLANPSPEEYAECKTASNGFQLLDMESINNDSEKTQVEENSDNHNIDNKVNENLPRKKRKLSPIVYNRSRSSSPVHTKPASLPLVTVKHLDKQIAADTLQPNVLEKSRDKCRYWPNCTLGIKCPYFHPTVLCSAFPSCKFGEKCLYKHPKCKFGLSCTKLGCVYSHPPRQCKYHPYCTNPTCAYTHPLPQVQPVEVIQRAKFTWRKHE